MPIEHPVAQGSVDWLRLRMGTPTASNFHRIVTPAKGKLSSQAKDYAYRLAWERLVNEPTQSLDASDWMSRGKEMEPRAVAQYQFVEEIETRPAGFFTTDDGLAGASPDRVIIGRSAGLEVKSPAGWTHLRYLDEGPGADYRCQVQGSLWVCAFDYWDFYSYHPFAPAKPLRFGRDEPFIAQISDAVAAFNEMLSGIVERVKALGAFQAYAEARTPVEVERAHQLRADIWDNGLAP